MKIRTLIVTIVGLLWRVLGLIGKMWQLNSGIEKNVRAPFRKATDDDPALTEEDSVAGRICTEPIWNPINIQSVSPYQL